ncbi:hypothetical protein MVEN_00725100 [Mycena venus]|uniref:Uncharacterized protein n=1 Tax=Mycena venus TaxID=2733690 RepID=A0A8H7D5E1_9AGAR|nr:hypothetical protein MVEN_00725100 [Mycena venus]
MRTNIPSLLLELRPAPACHLDPARLILTSTAFIYKSSLRLSTYRTNHSSRCRSVLMANSNSEWSVTLRWLWEVADSSCYAYNQSHLDFSTRPFVKDGTSSVLGRLRPDPLPITTCARYRVSRAIPGAALVSVRILLRPSLCVFIMTRTPPDAVFLRPPPAHPSHFSTYHFYVAYAAPPMRSWRFKRRERRI